MKKPLLWFISTLLLFFLCSCQTDFTKPADYVFDTKNKARTYTLDLSGLELPNTSKTFVLEVKNSKNGETEYGFTTSVIGTLPLTCTFLPETEDESIAVVNGSAVTGRLQKNKTHRYILTVEWRAEENSYLYAGGTASVTVDGFAEP